MSEEKGIKNNPFMVIGGRPCVELGKDKTNIPSKGNSFRKARQKKNKARKAGNKARRQGK